MSDDCLLCGKTREERQHFRDADLFWGACQGCASAIIREELARRVPEKFSERKAQEMASIDRALERAFYE